MASALSVFTPSCHLSCAFAVGRRMLGLVVLCWLSIGGLRAQQHEGELWGAYIGSVEINPTWQVWHDYHFVNDAFGMVRVGLTYQVPRGYALTAGYARVWTTVPATQRLNRQENRLWGQVVKNYKLHPKWRYSVRFRYDGRFRQSLNSQGEVVPEAYTFNNRFRLMQSVRHALTAPVNGRYWHLNLINETLLNTGRRVPRGFDQIRSYLLAGYTRPGITVLAGYHQRFIPRKTGDWTMNHGLTVWLIHAVRRQARGTAEEGNS